MGRPTTWRLNNNSLRLSSNIRREGGQSRTTCVLFFSFGTGGAVPPSLLFIYQMKQILPGERMRALSAPFSRCAFQFPPPHPHLNPFLSVLLLLS